MTAKPSDGGTSHSGEAAPRRPRPAPDPPPDDRIGNRLPVWGTRADDPTGPIDLHANPTEFEVAYSGGWGAPGHVDATGPIPRLGRTSGPAGSDASDSAGRESGGAAGGDGTSGGTGEASRVDDTVHGLPADTATTWHSRTPLTGDIDPFTVSGDTAAGDAAAGDATGAAPVDAAPVVAPRLASDHFVYSKAPGAATSPGPAPLGRQTVDPARLTGRAPLPVAGPPAGGEAPILSGLTDFGFRTRTARTLAPVAYALLIALLVLGYVANVYTTAMAAATDGDDLGGAVIVALVGLVAVAFGVVAGRILIETACNVADLAARRDR